MQSLEPVSGGTHATLRMRPAAEGGGIFARIVLSEFYIASAACPLLLSKHADTGAFYVGAMLGFKSGEHLIDSPDGQPSFQPLEALREGFFASGENFVLDRGHDRFAARDGVALFDGHGNPTAPLQAAQTALGRLMAGSEATDAFIAKLVSYRLVEPIDISLNFDDGERIRLEGLYTVSLDALSELDDTAALDLFRSGDMQYAYAMITSLQHISLMARRRNERLVSA